MAAKEIIPLYDLMVQLFVVSMPQCKIPVQLLGHIMNIPPGTMVKVVNGCPFPSGAKLTRGGHRGLEVFITQPLFVSRVDRAAAVQIVKDKPEWGPYGVVLPVLADDIIAQVEKVIENIMKLKGGNIKKAAIIKNGCPEVYRLSWFVKDPIQGEFYKTVQEAMGKVPSKKDKFPVVVPVPMLQMPKLAPSTPEQMATYRAKHHVSPLDNYSLINFVTDIQGLITSKDEYIAVIKRMENKINREYPALIALKEAEKVAAEKNAGKLKDRVVVLEHTNSQLHEEIKNLKKHPKFAGFVRISEIKK